MRKVFILLVSCLFFINNIQAQQKITIPSKDSVNITADMYVANDTLPFIILLHQEGYSRGEYNEIAKKVNKLGFNCVAIDLRSGKEVNGVKNETAILAQTKRKGQSHLDAEQDIVAAIEFVFFMSEKKVILWGSSYTSILALKVASTNDKVKAVMAFSPGDYFQGKLNVKEAIKNVDKPVFITSEKEFSSDVLVLTKDMKSKEKAQFTPKGKGEHGSKSLWNSSPDNLEYWTAVILFLKDVRN